MQEIEVKGEIILNQLQAFKNPEFGEVRWIRLNNKDYAVGIDIAKALGYSNASKAVIQHCKGITKTGIPSNGGVQETNVITEGDIYRLAAKSELPGAERFERWIFDDVLPSIRKTGGYVNSDELFVDTYLPYVDDNTKAMFKTNLSMIRKQSEIIAAKEKELEHKEVVIVGLVDEITLAEKRQVLNRVVKFRGANYQERWRELYRQFEMKYHVNLESKLDVYNKTKKPKLKNKVDYIDKVMNKVPELYEIACKLFESDVKELARNLYSLTEEVI